MQKRRFKERRRKHKVRTTKLKLGTRTPQSTGFQVLPPPSTPGCKRRHHSSTTTWERKRLGFQHARAHFSRADPKGHHHQPRTPIPQRKKLRFREVKSLAPAARRIGDLASQGSPTTMPSPLHSTQSHRRRPAPSPGTGAPRPNSSSPPCLPAAPTAKTLLLQPGGPPRKRRSRHRKSEHPPTRGHSSPPPTRLGRCPESRDRVSTRLRGQWERRFSPGRRDYACALGTGGGAIIPGSRPVDRCALRCVPKVAVAEPRYLLCGLGVRLTRLPSTRSSSIYTAVDP